MRRRSLLAGLVPACVVATSVLGTAMSDATAAPLDPENTLYIDLKDGRVVIELLPDLAPRRWSGSRPWRARGSTTTRRFIG